MTNNKRWNVKEREGIKERWMEKNGRRNIQKERRRRDGRRKEYVNKNKTKI